MIKVTENYFVKVEENYFTVMHKQKSKNTNKDYFVPDAYYGTLTEAIEKIMRLEQFSVLKEKDLSLHEAIAILKESQDRFKGELKALDSFSHLV